MSHTAANALLEAGEDTCSTEQNIRRFPLAIGPCRVYRKSDAPRTSRWTKLPLWCCGDVFNNKNSPSRSKWQNCHVTLFSDSSMSIHAGLDSSAPVLASFKMVDLYKSLAFGDDILNVPGRMDLPQIPSNSWENVLAVPDEPHCNSTINWLDFSSKDTLNMWLIAICRSLPPEMLIVKNKSKNVLENEKTSLNRMDHEALKAHIKLFFSRRSSKAGLKHSRIPTDRGNLQPHISDNPQSSASHSQSNLHSL